ncbi:hypothetical protein CR513_10499, partial [Mucuna pruriens]
CLGDDAFIDCDIRARGIKDVTSLTASRVKLDMSLRVDWPIGSAHLCAYVVNWWSFLPPERNGLCTGSPSEWSSDSSQPSGSFARGDETQHSTTPTVEGEFPFKILFWEAEKSNSKGLPSWINPGVTGVYSVYTHPNSLVGMADAICQHGPWSVEVLPCRLDEIVCKWAVETEEPFFYFYETLFLKLGIKLPFTNFEQAAFVWAFELLSEDIGREPSLSVYFWFFSLRRVEKVGWTLLSSQPQRKLMKPFQESYKFFKDHFFQVPYSHIGSSMLFGNSRDPFFPLYCSDQPAVSVIGRKNLLKISASCSLFPVRSLQSTRMRSSCSTTPAVGEVVAEALPLSTAQLEPSQPFKESAQPPLVVVLDFVKDSPLPVVVGASDSLVKHMAKEGVLQS